ncbi:MAG: pectate lyase [Pirellulales bacterium]|nr:pectate lyase [Pirellulales bacterium]
MVLGNTFAVIALVVLQAVATPSTEESGEVNPKSSPITWSNAQKQQPGFYASKEGICIGDNVLAYQRPCGGWSKSKNTPRIADLTLSDADREAIRKAEARAARNYDRSNRSRHSHRSATLDNGATCAEIRFLAKVYSATKLDRFRTGCLKGIDYLLAAQYPNGGWPQCYPNLADYGRHITFNDDAMTSAMRVLREIAKWAPEFTFVDDIRRKKAKTAFEKGVDCILKCQIVVQGHPTAWCQQHDAVTFEPRGARIYEKPSIAGVESVGVLRLLMSIEPPEPEVVRAIQAAVAWFDDAKLTGIMLVTRQDPSKKKVYQIPIRENPAGSTRTMRFEGTGKDKIIVNDPSAPPMWARFHEIGTNKPIFCGWDGVVRYSLAEIDYERRIRYSWYTRAAATLLAKEYPAWQRKWAPDKNMLDHNRVEGTSTTNK